MFVSNTSSEVVTKKIKKIFMIDVAYIHFYLFSSLIKKCNDGGDRCSCSMAANLMFNFYHEV